MVYGIALIVSGSRGNRLLFLCIETGTNMCVVDMPVMNILTIRQVEWRVCERSLTKVSAGINDIHN